MPGRDARLVDHHRHVAATTDDGLATLGYLDHFAAIALSHDQVGAGFPWEIRRVRPIAVALSQVLSIHHANHFIAKGAAYHNVCSGKLGHEVYKNCVVRLLNKGNTYQLSTSSMTCRTKGTNAQASSPKVSLADARKHTSSLSLTVVIAR